VSWAQLYGISSLRPPIEDSAEKLRMPFKP